MSTIHKEHGDYLQSVCVAKEEYDFQEGGKSASGNCTSKDNFWLEGM